MYFCQKYLNWNRKTQMDQIDGSDRSPKHLHLKNRWFKLVLLAANELSQVESKVKSLPEWTYPACLKQFASEVLRGILECEFLTSHVVHRCSFQVQKEIIFKANLARLLLVLEIDLHRQQEAAITILSY